MPKRPRPRAAVTNDLLLAGRTLSSAMIMFHTALAAKQGLSVSEEKALDLLQRYGPMTAGELGSKSGLAPASITGLIDRLEKKGFARRVPDAADGRRVRVEVRPERLADFAPLFGDLVREMQSLAEQYSVAELELLVGFMNEAARRQHACAARLSSVEA